MSFRAYAFSLALLSAMTIPADARAQTTQSIPVPNRPACSAVLSLVSILVRDTEGKPVPGTTVAMTRLRDSKSLGKATEMRAGQGEFALLESDALRWVATKGDRIRVRARAGKRTASAVIVVGRDSSGCKITVLSGPAVLTLK